MIGSTARRRLAPLGLAWGLALLSASAGPMPADTPSALETDPAGWTDLIAEAGPGLKGWTRATLHPTDKLAPESQWSVDTELKVLLCEGNRGHEWLRYDRELADFILHAEWKFTPLTAGKKGYNSGIYVRNSADARVWHQAQVGGGPDAFLFGETLKDEKLVRINLNTKAADKRVRPAGEWNAVELTCKGKDVDFWVNGGVVNEWRDCQVPRGFVGLEAEGYRIEFRNVKVKPL